MFTISKHLLWGSLLALSLAFSAASFAGDTLQRVIDFKVLKVGMSGNQPPFTAVSKSGKPMGFDVELARALAAAMHVKLELKTMPFGELMTALENDKIDMVISGMEITPERYKELHIKADLPKVKKKVSEGDKNGGNESREEAEDNN